MNITTGMTCGILALIPGALLSVWIGKHYDNAAYLMSIFSIAAQANLMTGPGTSILRGIGRPSEEFRYNIPNLIALVIAVPLSYVLIGKWTTVGIGTAVAVSTVLSAAYFIGRANRLMDVSTGTYLKSVFLPGAAPYTVAALFTAPAAFIVSQLSRWAAGGCLIVLLAAYGLLLLAVVNQFILEPGERMWFQAVVRAKLKSYRSGG